MTVGSGGRVGTIGVGVGVAGEGVAVGGLVGTEVGDGEIVGEAVGAGVGAVVGTCAGAGVAGAGVGLAVARVPPFPLGPGPCEGKVAEAAGVSDGLAVAVAEGPPPTLWLTSLVAVKAASARPTPSAGPSTRYSANDVRTGRPLMTPRTTSWSRPTPRLRYAHSCAPIFRCRCVRQWQRRVR